MNNNARMEYAWEEGIRVRVDLHDEDARNLSNRGREIFRHHGRSGVVVHLEEITEGHLACYGDLTVKLEPSLENPEEEYETFFRREVVPESPEEERRR